MKSRDASVEREKLDAGELSRREFAEFSPSSTFSLFLFSTFFLRPRETVNAATVGSRGAVAGGIVGSSVFFPAASSLTARNNRPVTIFLFSFSLVLSILLFIILGIYLSRINVAVNNRGESKGR